METFNDDGRVVNAAQNHESTGGPGRSESDHSPRQNRSPTNTTTVRSVAPEQDPRRRIPQRQCHICHRIYERADHLSRHIRSHENARAFPCPTCGKRFNRGDLLHRHMGTHQRNDVEINTSNKSNRASNHPNKRVVKACSACAVAKARCEDEKPCQRCKLKNIACEPVPVEFRSYRNVKRLLSRDFGHDNPPEAAVTTHTFSSYESGNRPHNSPYGLAPTSMLCIDPPGVNLGHMDFGDLTTEMLFYPDQANFNSRNVDLSFCDFNIQDEHLFLSTISDLPNPQQFPAAIDSTPRTIRDVSHRHAAFTRSPWLWTPAQTDHMLVDQDNLAVDTNSIPSKHPPISSGLIVPSCGFPVISPQTRDQMFYLVATMDKYTKSVVKFPSLDVLNYIIAAFFARHSYQVDDMFHVPSITSTEILPELLLSLVTAGTVCIAVPAIWKLGLVLQDVVRHTTSQLWEKENTNTRKLQPLQSWMLFLETGIWCGYQRQMELAESFTLPLVTMIRRGGIFAGHPDQQALVPVNSDDGSVLTSKWKTWAQREAFKRLCIRLFLHDMSVSIALQKTPLISISELTFSLPASRELFQAGSAPEWKDKYLSHKLPLKLPMPRMADTLHECGIGDCGEYADVRLCHKVALYAYWSQIWAFREASKFHLINEKPDSVHRLWISAQQRELNLEIVALKEKFELMRNAPPGLLLTAELFLVALQISLEDLQRFAGKSGVDAADQAFNTLQSWSSTERARKAVWHAAQVFRWASSLPPAKLRDFYAIALYFAALTIWAYGHLCAYRSRAGSDRLASDEEANTPDHSPSFVVINDSETRETRGFISGNKKDNVVLQLFETHTTPSLHENQHSVQYIRISDPNAVLKLACDIYRKNFPVLEEPPPPLVENMANLMQDLSSQPESRFSRAVSPAER